MAESGAQAGRGVKRRPKKIAVLLARRGRVRTEPLPQEEFHSVAGRPSSGRPDPASIAGTSGAPFACCRAFRQVRTKELIVLLRDTAEHIPEPERLEFRRLF
jgi:hypothetical protein